MSKFTSLPTDNPKTGPQEDTIFYRSQSTLTDQYQSARLEQQQKQQRLLSKLNPPNQPPNHSNNQPPNTTNHRPAHRARPKLKPVTKFAVGGNRRNKPTNLKTNKPSVHSQSQLLRNYKKQYSRSEYDEFKKEDLPAGTLKCSLFKKSLGCNRGYVGHFVGSKGPRFPKSKIRAIREEDLQTQLERIQYNKSLNAKKRDQLIAKLKFGLEEEEEKSNAHLGAREFWFEFEEGSSANTSTNNKDTKGSNDSDDAKRLWLGKPKQKDKNYSYVLMEWTGTTRTATVYPATFIEFGLSKQLVADGETTSESAEKRHKSQLAKWRKKQAEKSVMEKLGNLFGHDDFANNKGKKKRLKADEITDEAKEGLKEMYLDKKALTNEEMEMLRDLMGDEQYTQFMEQYKEIHTDSKRGSNQLVTGDDTRQSLIERKVLSKRLKTHKTRGQLEELADYNEFMSDDDGIENNLNDYDFLDSNEEDLLTDEDGNESEADEVYQKLQKHIGSDLVNKEYELPEKELKNGLFDNDSDDEEEGEVELTITDDDDDDEEDDMDGNVQIVKANTNNKEANNNKGKKRKLDGNKENGPSKKKRKLNAVDEGKLKEELTVLITKILKKFSDGLEMLPLWRKITASLSADPQIIKKLLPPVLKNLARTNDKGGKKKYCLKDKFK